MSEQPFVTAIIIFYNSEAFFAESIQSILCQSYANWELLLVDDGSTDGSTAVAKQYATQYPDKVRYLCHPGHVNRGMSATRNLGICEARGEFVAFLDADDVWLPDKLTEQVALMQALPEAGMLYGRTQIWYSWTGNPADANRDELLDLGVTPNSLIQPPTLFLLMLENKVQTPTTCNVIIRRQVFEKVGGFQADFKDMFEDQAFFTKVCLHTPIYVADVCWARYRQHPDSCCAIADESGADRQAWLTLLNWILAYLVEQEIADTIVWQAVRRAKWKKQHPRLMLAWYQIQTWFWRSYEQLLKLPGGQTLQRRIRAVLGSI